MEECCICFELVDKNLTTCGHLICQNCTREVLNDPCPLCRRLPVQGGYYDDIKTQNLYPFVVQPSTAESSAIQEPIEDMEIIEESFDIEPSQKICSLRNNLKSIIEIFQGKFCTKLSCYISPCFCYYTNHTINDNKNIFIVFIGIIIDILLCIFIKLPLVIFTYLFCFIIIIIFASTIILLLSPFILATILFLPIIMFCYLADLITKRCE